MSPPQVFPMSKDVVTSFDNADDGAVPYAERLPAAPQGGGTAPAAALGGGMGIAVGGMINPAQAELFAMRELNKEFDKKLQEALKDKEESKREVAELTVQLTTAKENLKYVSEQLKQLRERNCPSRRSEASGSGLKWKRGSGTDQADLNSLRYNEAAEKEKEITSLKTELAGTQLELADAQSLDRRERLRAERSKTNLYFLALFIACASLGPALVWRRR